MVKRSERPTGTLGDTLVVLAVVVVASLPALQIYLWGDDFTNLNLAYRLHEDPSAVFQMPYLFFRPLMLVSMYLSYLFFGTQPLLYNILTLVHHLVNVALLHRLMLRMGSRRVSAIAVALLFGTTPLASEATTWSGARADVLLVTVVLSLLLFLTGRHEVMKIKNQFVVLLLLATGLCIKESWMVLPLLLWFFMVLVNGVRLRTAALASGPGWVLLSLYVFRFFFLPVLRGGSSPLDYSAEVNDVGTMVGKFGMLITHTLSIGQANCGEEPRAMIGLALFVVVAGVALLQRNHVAVFGGLMMVLAWVPSIHFSVSPSRFNYWALIGFWIAIVGVVERVFNHLDQPGRIPRWFLLGALTCVTGGLTFFQAIVLQSEFRDYDRFGERHRMLVDFVNQVEADLGKKQLVLVANLGRIDGPVEFQRSVEGIVKNIYPRSGGLWNLVYFDHLANFDGRPFERRFEEVPPAEIDRSMILDCEVLIFSDNGFKWCTNCLQGITTHFDIEKALPTRIRMYRRVKVGMTRSLKR